MRIPRALLLPWTSGKTGCGMTDGACARMRSTLLQGHVVSITQAFILMPCYMQLQKLSDQNGAER